ncbi:hypothetical protein ON010_g7431 [Phytophthora cinnamomi]|nr:hypothetical protein ON010_g7431 [Phytophthora cinnamomi]
MRFGFLVLGALIVTITAEEAGASYAVTKENSKREARALYIPTADQEERGRNFPGEASHQVWWPNFKAWFKGWFKRIFSFWWRHNKDATQRLR